MELFILRHGHAVAEAPKDSLRELSPDGRIEVQTNIERNKEKLGNINALVVSPYLRAQQTAEIVRNILGDIPKVDSSLFTPGGNPKKAIEALHEMYNDECQSIMVVGHQPLLGILLDDLCGAEPGKFRMGTASLAAIDSDVMLSGLCYLRWLEHVSR